MPGRRFHLGLFAVALGGFLLRWLHVGAISGTPLYSAAHGDGEAYLRLAASLREACSEEGLAGLLRPGEVDYQAPLYPHLLALLQSVFGEDLLVLRRLQAGLGALSVFLIGLGTGRMLGERAGLLAAVLLAAFAPSIWLDGLIQKSALSGFLVTLVIALWSYRVTHSAGRAAFGLGLAMGCLMLTRGEARLWACVLAGFLALRGTERKRAAILLAYAAGLALVLMPGFVRNGVYGGDWVLTTSQAGTNVYIGNRTGASGTYSPLVPGRGDARYEADDAKRLAEEASGYGPGQGPRSGPRSGLRSGLSPSEVSGYWRDRALAEMGADPAGAARLLGKKLLLAFNGVEVADTHDLRHARRASWVLRITLPFAALMAFASLGWVLAEPHERRRLHVFVALGAAQVAALVIFYVFARYRLPLSLVLMPMAGLGLASLGRLRERSPVVPLAVALGAVGITFLPVLDPGQGTAAALVNEGRALVESSEFARAELLAHEAVELSPDFFDAHRLLALTHLKRDQTAEARPYLEKAHELAPGDWQVRTWLGIALGEAGELERAHGFLVDAALERPEATPIVSNAVALSLALDRQGDAVRVLRTWRADDVSAQGASADHMALRLQLAWLLATARDPNHRSGHEALEVLEGLANDGQVRQVRAAALAETGRFQEAANLTNVPAHRAAYAEGRPWRE